ncbi:hypothetical protein EHQ68_11205 [Leptospira congkakensis]|uniref:HTH HARE-type domain-containing protein n=1 Tax=Leptospira congkakensis TaxID=2484932 RepID=A0A4Z1A4A6_9LEPT|nr:HTH domain-containing protein [Leptospira congkakensis]TGL87120.1 hypothetical protein EHQ68_11205 [Leptospira congkakensis]TGL96688.1 hypothetical protein EHQ69_00150 [Leptospira congkakensis]TGL97537.1 hypothetical protein EHQ70_05805 [Leptospira congkakensis]
MAQSLSFLEIAQKALVETGSPMSPSEIWAFAESKKWKTDSVGKTPWATISAQIYVSIKNDPISPFQQVSKRPTRFALSGWGETIDRIVSDFNARMLEEENIPVKERKLHPVLTQFVFSHPHFRAYTKTIYHEISTKSIKGKNRWLHPDLVGVRFNFDEYTEETVSLQKLMATADCYLFSFEVKVNLHFGNLREAFFQAVSNSSWANEGYLAALNIEEDSDLMDELSRLSKAFGIGVLKLDSTKPEESEILFQSNPKPNLDFTTIDRLAEENKNFRDFLKNIAEDVKLGKVKSSYDTKE